ncbi:GDP-mannose 4,6-dehydratase [Herbaspirillum rubrisubalbicans]|uniref:GDP-mannose 4,6-dehydratase n=1 Tax=Herbaspirillum rubrisubalbicans TaxID=80842 RepID=UPI0015586E53|nr:GDP-mannose 4,6-dehydratase [Herbaspirillum rubrisubalbicans]NQE51534.1 GDP-6-deoxy-D-lyxo-4-hexulose reductase [Herbaspirillum rubrisubalbicans]
MKILVTGARGFTGQHFSVLARKRGHTVIDLQSDLTDAAALKAELLEVSPEAVVHLAAIAFVGHADPSAFYKVNVVGSTNLLDALRQPGISVRKVLLASSANVYGNTEQSPITEDQLPAPANHYACSKLAMENMARNYLGDLPLFFTRPFNYTGPGQDPSFVIPKLVSHYARRAERIDLGNIDVEREFNDVRFVVGTYLDLLDKAITGQTYNVCTGISHSLKSVIATLEKLSQHQLKIGFNPAFARQNEIARLCGSPDKLFATIGQPTIPALEETLDIMLRAAA